MIEKLATFGGRRPRPGPLKKTMKGPPGSGPGTPKKLARFGAIQDLPETPKKTIKGDRGIPQKKSQKSWQLLPHFGAGAPPFKKTIKANRPEQGKNYPKYWQEKVGKGWAQKDQERERGKNRGTLKNHQRPPGIFTAKNTDRPISIKTTKALWWFFQEGRGYPAGNFASFQAKIFRSR